jgi:hypothetical protein
MPAIQVDHLKRDKDLRVMGLIPIRTIALATDERSEVLRLRAIKFGVGLHFKAGDPIYNAFVENITIPRPAKVEAFLPPSDAVRFARASLGFKTHNLDVYMGRISCVQLETALGDHVSARIQKLGIGSVTMMDKVSSSHLILCGINPRKVSTTPRHRWLSAADLTLLARHLSGFALEEIQRIIVTMTADELRWMPSGISKMSLPDTDAPAPVDECDPEPGLPVPVPAVETPMPTPAPPALAGQVAAQLANLKTALEICVGAETIHDAEIKKAIRDRALQIIGL